MLAICLLFEWNGSILLHVASRPGKYKFPDMHMYHSWKLGEWQRPKLID